MTTPLQKTGYKDSEYERPNQKWICGWARLGEPCEIGPDSCGKCAMHAQTSCQPRKEGDRWLCTRSPLHGGPCPDGPKPDGACCRPKPERPICQPKQSLRARRGRLSATCVIFVFGLLVLLLAGPWHAAFISPGPLTIPHSAISPPVGASNNCAVCHTAMEQGGLSWLQTAIKKPRTTDDSNKCLSCHYEAHEDPNTDDHFARFAHSIEPAHLSKITAQHQVTAPSSNSPTVPLALASLAGTPMDVSDSGQMSCSVCHREHRGREHKLAHMDDTSCQVCHSTQFHSFNDGHPPFGPPIHHTRGIDYNHQDHMAVHFGEEVFSCRRCHQPDAVERTMRLRGYDQACASCHQQGRDEHHTSELKKNHLLLFQLPEMELDDTYWPPDTALGEQLTPMVRLLLAGDTQALPALKAFMEDEDADQIPYDWEPEDDESRQLLVDGIKRLITDLSTNEAEANERIRLRLASALGRGTDDTGITRLAEQLAAARSSVTAFQQSWLPQLQADLEGNQVDLDESPVGGGSEGPTYPAGWYVDADNASVNYGAVAHGDRFLKALIDTLAAGASPAPDHETLTDQPASDTQLFLQRVRTEVFEEMATKDFGGPLYSSCLRCHTVDLGSDGYTVNWLAAGRQDQTSGYGKFNHKPHLAILNEPNSCRVCHKFAEHGGTTAAQIGTPISRGFQPHNRENCATCHAPKKASNSCLNCHQYHLHRPKDSSTQIVTKPSR